MQLINQVDNIFTTLDQSNPICTKRGIVHSHFNFLFGNSNSAKEMKTIKNNMAILIQNQDILNNQMQKTFNFINLTCVETDTNSLLLKSLQKDILQINSTVHHLSKEIKSLFHDRTSFVIMFQLRNHLAILHNGINLVKIDILSIFNQVSIISAQKLKLVLLNPLDLKSLPTKLETELVLYPRFALPQWNGENILVYVQFHETLITFYVRHHICHIIHPLVDNLLQFNLYRIHNIPLVHPILKKSFRYSIQEEYLVIRSDAQYILFPVSTDILACQVSNGSILSY